MPYLLNDTQVSEERLISLLEQINEQTSKQTKVTVCCEVLLPCSLSKWAYCVIYTYKSLCIFRFIGVEVFLRMMISSHYPFELCALESGYAFCVFLAIIIEWCVKHILFFMKICFFSARPQNLKMCLKECHWYSG